MITEDYCSFEIAKLLKEKGFDELCSCLYNKSTKERTNPREYVFNGEWSAFVLCPTLQMATKWLREVHNIHVVPKFDFYAGDYTGRIYDGRRDTITEKDDYVAVVGNETYEQACEAAIKYCLEHLI